MTDRTEPRRPVQDLATIEGFGQEWRVFDQSALDESDLRAIFDQYFAIFPWEELPEHARGIDVGCGTGRWAHFVAPRVGHLLCLDASEQVLDVARRMLGEHSNVEIRHGAAGALPVDDGSVDFGYSLGVLHHTPDPATALRDCVRTLRQGAPFLVYLYYAFDNRPAWFRGLWRISDAVRRLISRLPFWARYWTTQVIAVLVYWPLARLAALAEQLGGPSRLVGVMPLSFYRNKPFYVMRNDALDRFGTRLEQRFTRVEIRDLMESAGLQCIQFSDDAPYWCAVGRKRGC